MQSTTVKKTEASESYNTELLSFRIAEQEYSVNIMAVREIRGWTRATSLPHAPNYVHGVINLRGTVLPVVDLARRLGIGSQAPSARSVIIVIDNSGRTVGVRVDAVSDILSVSVESMQAPPDTLSDGQEGFIMGLIVIDERMVRVLNIDTLFPPDIETAA